MPTLGEFIAQARRDGFRKRSLTIERGPRGRATIVYLWRDADHFAELPGVRENDRLTRDVVETLCRKLWIPGEDFGVDA
jgi:hypothetical protein